MEYLVIDPASSRRKAWEFMFGQDFVPVLPGGPVLSTIGTQNLSHLTYAVALGLLDTETWKRMLDVIAWDKNLPVPEVRKTLLDEGFAILADQDVRLCSDPEEGRAFFRRIETVVQALANTRGG